MKAKITKRIVDAAKPGDRDWFIWDTEVKGFGVKITPAGNKIYLVQKRLPGETLGLRRTIGKHGSPYTPDQARAEAVKILGQMADGVDPLIAKRQAKRNITIAALCDLYLEEGCETKKSSTVAMDRGRIERHVKPLLGRKRLHALTRADVEKFMKDIAAGKTAQDVKTKMRGRSIVRGGTGAATRTVGMLGAILQFAVSRDLRTDNPVRGVKRYSDSPMERFLSPRELADLGDALVKAEGEGENKYAIAAIRLLALTGCRRNEILSLEWEWVDMEGNRLSLPDSKTGARHVPLGAAAKELLQAIPRIEDSAYVFPGTSGDGHFVGLQKVWSGIRKKAGLSDVRLNDLRHGFASVGTSGGDTLYLVGKLLGHRRAASSERYAHLAADPLHAAADRISGQIAAAMDRKDSAEVVELKQKG